MKHITTLTYWLICNDPSIWSHSLSIGIKL